MKKTLQDGFRGAALKVERANCHISEYEAALNEIKKIDVNLIFSKTDPNHGGVISLTDIGGAAEPMPTIIGDAIHNLRTAFDHLWMTLIRAAGHQSKAYFPFHETRKNLEDAVDKSPVTQSFPVVRDIILNDLKPYGEPGGNRVLWTITKFDKIDKHNLIIPVLNSYLVNAEIRTGGLRINLSNNRFSGSHQNIVGGNIPLEYEQKGRVEVDIVFPHDSFLPRESVLPALINMSESTAKAVDLFKKTFL